MQDHTLDCQAAIFMENIGAEATSWCGVADRISEGALVGPLMWLSGAQDNACPQLWGGPAL